jgi:hypothetical protein
VIVSVVSILPYLSLNTSFTVLNDLIYDFLIFYNVHIRSNMSPINACWFSLFVADRLDRLDGCSALEYLDLINITFILYHPSHKEEIIDTYFDRSGTVCLLCQVRTRFPTFSFRMLCLIQHDGHDTCYYIIFVFFVWRIELVIVSGFYCILSV